MSQLHPSSSAAYVADIEEFRQQKDQFFKSSDQSPIPRSLRADGFSGLRYYPPDLAYRVEADCIPFDTKEITLLGTTQGEIRRYERYGELRFTVMGAEYRLIAFKPADEPDSHELFIPFRDATSGGETYGAGRYVEVEDDSEDNTPHKVVLDFNLAYSPWCAYSEAYSCTLPPPENRIAAPIMAGELLFPIDH